MEAKKQQSTNRAADNRMYALSAWSVEFGQLRTGTGMEVSLTVFSRQRWDAEPLDSFRRWGLLCTVSTRKPGGIKYIWLVSIKSELEGKVLKFSGLTQESWVSVTQGKALVARDAEGGQHVEALVQERLEARGRGVGRVEQVVNLLTGRTQSRHWRRRHRKDGKS